MTLPGIWLNEDNSHYFFTRAAIHAGYNVIEVHAGEAITVQ